MAKAMAETEEAFVRGGTAELRFPPRKGFVTVAADFAKAFCAEHTEDSELLARVQLAAHELAENVVKYSTGEICVMRVECEPSAMPGQAPGTLWITTENEVAPGPLQAADRYLSQLEQAQNADMFYDAQIAESAKRTNGSGLGLARIRSEALMEISHRAQEGQLMVRVAARFSGYAKERVS